MSIKEWCYEPEQIKSGVYQMYLEWEANENLIKDLARKYKDTHSLDKLIKKNAKLYEKICKKFRKRKIN